MFVEPLKWMTNGKISLSLFLKYFHMFPHLILFTGYKHPTILGMFIDVYA